MASKSVARHLLLTVFLLLCVMMVFAGKPNSTPANDPSLINRINSKNVGWKAKAHKIFSGKTLGELKKMVGGWDASIMAHFKDIIDKVNQHAKEKEASSGATTTNEISNNKNEQSKSTATKVGNESNVVKKGKKGKKPTKASSTSARKTTKKGNRTKASRKSSPKTTTGTKRKAAKTTKSSTKRKVSSGATSKKPTKTLKRRVSSGGVSTLGKKSSSKSSSGGSSSSAIPSSFDSREKWPNCPPLIRQQFECGSCYAFAATGALAHRFCVASRGKINLDLAPDHIVRCNPTTKACLGGRNVPTWEFLESTGVPTTQCVLYRSGYFFVQECPATCDDGSALQLYKSVPGSLKQLQGDDEIKRAIMTEGSVHTNMIVLRDFVAYDGGIYTMNSDTIVGPHAVQLIGWGQENGKDYWIGVNSWGETWGEKGTFRIQSDQVGIGRLTHAGKAQL